MGKICVPIMQALISVRKFLTFAVYQGHYQGTQVSQKNAVRLIIKMFGIMTAIKPALAVIPKVLIEANVWARLAIFAKPVLVASQTVEPEFALLMQIFVRLVQFAMPVVDVLKPTTPLANAVVI